MDYTVQQNTLDLDMPVFLASSIMLRSASIDNGLDSFYLFTIAWQLGRRYIGSLSPVNRIEVQLFVTFAQQ